MAASKKSNLEPKVMLILMEIFWQNPCKDPKDSNPNCRAILDKIDAYQREDKNEVVLKAEKTSPRLLRRGFNNF